MQVALDFGATVTAESVDTLLASAIAGRSIATRPAHIVFNFSATTFAEPTALQMAIAWMVRFRRAGNLIALRIPKSQKARDFWRAWGFPQAINDALGENEFRQMVPQEDSCYFGEKQTTYLPSSLPAHPGFPGGTIRSTNFFGFYSTSVKGGMTSGRLAYEEKDSWNAAHIRAVLTAKLGDDANYFASRVVATSNNWHFCLTRGA